MDWNELQTLLETDHSKALTLQVRDLIGDDPQAFALLWRMIKEGDPPLPQRGAWVLSYCVQERPELIEPHLNEITALLQKPTHDAVTRALLRSLSFSKLPEGDPGELYDLCLGWVDSPLQAIAVRVFAMEVVFLIAQQYPELKEEVIMVIEAHLPYGSAGFRSRGKRIIKKLRRI